MHMTLEGLRTTQPDGTSLGGLAPCGRVGPRATTRLHSPEPTDQDVADGPWLECRGAGLLMSSWPPHLLVFSSCVLSPAPACRTSPSSPAVALATTGSSEGIAQEIKLPTPHRGRDKRIKIRRKCHRRGIASDLHVYTRIEQIRATESSCLAEPADRRTVMVASVMHGTEEQGFIDDTAVDPALLAALVTDLAPMNVGSPTSRPAVLLELAGIKTAIRTWYDKQPDQVIREASAYSARLTELWTNLRELEEHDREYKQLRTMQVQPVLDEIDRQYRFAQSKIAMLRQDLDLMTKGT